MRKRKPIAGILVLVELGAQWPSWVQNLSGGGGKRVVSQEEGESPDAFGDRVAEELSRLGARGVPLKVATLACNERCDDAAMQARSKIGTALLGALVQKRARDFRFYLSASNRSGRARQALSSLATELGRSFGAPEERVSVRFGDDAWIARRAAGSAVVRAPERETSAKVA
jgi:hypothetical protein